MEKILLRYIDFNKCSSYQLLVGVFWLVSVAAVRVTAIPQEPVQAAISSIQLFLTLYVYLGFVKYSFIQRRPTFRRLIFVAMTLSIIQYIIAMTVSTANKEFYTLNGISLVIECVLLYYAFFTVRDAKFAFFAKISKLYLYLSLLLIPLFIFVLLGKDGISNLPHIVLLTLILATLAAAILMVAIWLFKIRLFKKISAVMY